MTAAPSAGEAPGRYAFQVTVHWWPAGDRSGWSTSISGLVDADAAIDWIRRGAQSAQDAGWTYRHTTVAPPSAFGGSVDQAEDAAAVTDAPDATQPNVTGRS